MGRFRGIPLIPGNTQLFWYFYVNMYMYIYIYIYIYSAIIYSIFALVSSKHVKKIGISIRNLYSIKQILI
jgi:hypothetical protein